MGVRFQVSVKGGTNSLMQRLGPDATFASEHPDDQD